MEKKYISKSFFGIVIFLVLLFLLFMDISNLFNTIIKKDITINFFNLKPFIVEDNIGDMEYGDLAIIKDIKLDDFKTGDRVVYKIGEKATINDVKDLKLVNGKKQIITENNNKINGSLIEGKYLFRIPLLGAFIIFLHTPFGALVIFSIMLLIATSCFQLSKRAKHSE